MYVSVYGTLYTHSFLLQNNIDMLYFVHSGFSSFIMNNSNDNNNDDVKKLCINFCTGICFCFLWVYTQEYNCWIIWLLKYFEKMPKCQSGYTILYLVF